MRFDYDMIVIGGGAAGLTAAGMSAVLGAKTALVEFARLGGDCAWHGCVPSKALLRAAAIAHEMRTAGRFGLNASDGPHDFARLMERVHEIREEIYRDADAPPNMERLGVEVIAGTARFSNARTLDVDGRALTSRWFVIATGSSPVIPDIGCRVLTNETLFELEQLPRRLLILGAGPVGIEMAQAFARLSSQVTVAAKSSRILQRDDPELTGWLRARLESEGITFRLGTSAAQITNAREFDAVLAALGRQPNTAPLNLAPVGVRTSANGIAVDRRCRTSVPHIYACGDAIGGPYFTHFAEHSAKVAVTNAILPYRATLDRAMPWCTFTEPELAHAGASERELQTRGAAYRVFRLPITKIDRARVESASEGIIKVLAARNGTVLGASILAARAGEMIGEFALAIRTGLRLDRISATVHPYPTWTLGDRQAADLFVQSRLTLRVGRWLRLLRGLRGDGRGLEVLSK